MIKLPEIGKISAEVFNELIFPHLGAERPEILVGPRHGVDVGIVKIGDKVIAMTSDPVFIVPEYGFERAAWFAVHILASDVVTSGLPPTYLTIDLNLPLSISEEQLTVVWKTIDRECKKMGMAIVCGHTARYDNCHYPMVGGATILALGDIDQYVSPVFARVGDRIIITKGPAIEAAGIFATMFPEYIAEEYGEDFAKKSQEIFFKMSVVEDALTAVSAGIRDNGVSSMHDATECGIWGGVFEIAEAAGVGARINKEAIVVEECVREICELFKIDPYKSISEGTLIITCREHKADAVVDALNKKGIKSSVVGELIEKKFGINVVEGKRERKIEHPRVDPFWKAFYDALERHKEFKK
ncbi:MAG TPA: AIR synthase [candidate division WOR-3 bacterium]|uniref:AIR synthase n=1 Tax=candidate division WOR-3 bacterium TaxID=2052148 RepID=A0A9C9ELH4_UNCW3|nr:AIR synthase [candidate division WOR-3 bacterium]